MNIHKIKILKDFLIRFSVTEIAIVAFGVLGQANDQLITIPLGYTQK